MMGLALAFQRGQAGPEAVKRWHAIDIRPMPMTRPDPPSPRRPHRSWMAVLTTAVLAYAAYLLFRRYGAQDVTEAEIIVYGMLLFLAGAALLAFFVVLLLRLVRPRGGRLIGAPEGEEDEKDRSR